MGIRAAIEGLKQFLLWDDRSLQGRLDARAAVWEVTELDYKGVNKVIYNENGVTIRSIPAIHAIDGAVSLENCIHILHRKYTYHSTIL